MGQNVLGGSGDKKHISCAFSEQQDHRVREGKRQEMCSEDSEGSGHWVPDLRQLISCKCAYGKAMGGAFFKSWVTGGLRHELLHLSCYWNGVPCKNKHALHWLLSWWTGLCLWLPQRTPSASLLPESGNVFLFILSTQMHHVDSRGCFKTGTCFIFFLFFPALYLVLVLD